MQEIRHIILSNKKTVLIDAEDFEFLNQWKWHVSNGYAARWSENREVIYMHRLVNKTPEGFFTDHINQNKLDNRKTNLRSVTKAENGYNTKIRKNNRSGHTGVSLRKDTGKWRAYINVDGEHVSLGSFSSKIEADQAYRNAVRGHLAGN